MINLKVHTEYSFRYSYGKIKDIVSKANRAIAITDRHTTFGHIPFWKECEKQGKKAIFGVELAFVEEAKLKVRQTAYYVTLLAINQNGLKKIYELTSKASLQKYYYPRLSFCELQKINEKDVIIIFQLSFVSNFLQNRQNTYYGISPLSAYGDYTKIKDKFPIIAISENLYDIVEHKCLYEIIIGQRFENRNTLSHILTKIEWSDSIRFLDKVEQNFAIENTEQVFSIIEDIHFEQAELPKQNIERTLLELCQEGAKYRKINLQDPIYKQRLEKELNLIKIKKYEKYFFLTKDLVDFAKKNMLVGPARGSSAGSLVCYLLKITDINPIPFNLIFERFIDLNRKDLPDIDIDFNDQKRLMCLDYLKEKYGKECVAKLGTISKYKPKSILTELSKVLEIPLWEIKDLKEAVIERRGGDARKSNCLEDTFNDMKIGKEFIKKFPKLRYSQLIENHNRHYGQHAAGIVVADKSLNHYCAVDLKSDGCMLDKHDAEAVNLLKIDCLGLRTLSVIEECLQLVGKKREWLLDYPLDDKKAFDVINSRKFHGIFQFEGYALISISKQIKIEKFLDIAIITALARPGPLVCGGTSKYIESRKNNKPKYLPLCKEFTKETFGVVIYQEQMMQIARKIGKLSWEDVSQLRKAASKSLGKEYFDKFYENFEKGALQNGLSIKESKLIWHDLCTMGSWAFNKCLGGETKVRMGATGSNTPQWITIKDLYDKYIENPTAWTKNKMPVLQSLFPDGRVRPQKAKMIYKNGFKHCIKYNFDDGTHIWCTEAHKFLINGKWKEIGKAKIGDNFKCSEYEKYKKKLISKDFLAKHIETYDIEMEEHHNYVIEGGLITHNSHAISYGMISYWCMVLKSKYPLEFALSTLKNAKSEEQIIQILKELELEGFEHKPFDKELSQVDWSIQNGKLIGGFINIKGIGFKKAEKLIQKRKEGKEFTVCERKLIYNAETPYDCVFEFEKKFGSFYKNWNLFVKEKPMLLKDIEGDGNIVRFLAKTVSIRLRDCNEAINIKKRGGKVLNYGCLKFLDLKFQDDTDSILARINRDLYEKLGSQIINDDKIGNYYLVCGKSCNGFRYIIIKNIKKITQKEISKRIIAESPLLFKK